MDKELFIYFSTSEPSYENLMAYKCVKKLIATGILKEGNWHCKCNNTESLAKNYNDALRMPECADKILVLIHSDLIIDDIFVKDKLNARFDRNKHACVVGIAGAKKISSKKIPHELWHLMSADGSRMGEVTNNVNDDILSNVYTTRFGPQGSRAIIIDGCFMAIDVERLNKLNVTFDESCPSKFNFYDLNFSLRCYWAGAEVYVDPIHVLHKSIGLTKMTDDFRVGNQFFKNNYLSRIWK